MVLNVHGNQTVYLGRGKGGGGGGEREREREKEREIACPRAPTHKDRRDRQPPPEEHVKVRTPPVSYNLCTSLTAASTAVQGKVTMSEKQLLGNN